MTRNRKKHAGILVAVFWLFAGCQAESSRPVLKVFAASSLTEVFEALEDRYEADHAVDIVFNFAGSQVLRMQIENGADADVFASANPTHMQALAQKGWVTSPVPFAHNELIVITPRDNPANIQNFEDLPNARRLVIGEPAVPIGRYTRKVFDQAARDIPAFSAIDAHVISRENNVRLARAKVVMREADAAVVYRTDAHIAGLHRVEIPAKYNVRADYPIAAVTRAARPQDAASFVAFVLSPRGQRVLENHGFLGAKP